jgi:hypothetical protein
MAIELRWLASASASALYAAAALSVGRTLADRKLHAAILAPSEDLLRALESLEVAPAKFFAQAIPAASRFDAPAVLIEAVLARLLPDSTAQRAAPRVARHVAALESAFALGCPNALAELELRGAPLGEQWEARGPGLMAALARATERELVVDAADVVLVLPALGGGGLAHPTYNAITFEAVLANPVAELPEILRLGWLLSQLTFDMPRFEDQLPRERVARIGPLAMIPPTLAAGEEVELTRLNGRTVELALSSWTDDRVAPVTLLDWWETYQATRPAWLVAVAALGEMIAAEPDDNR